MNKNLIIAFLMGTIITLLVVNYLPKFDIKIEVTEKSETLKKDKTEKNELSEQTSIVDRLKSKIIPEPIPEITADEFLLQNYPDTRIYNDREFFKGEQSKYIKNAKPKARRIQTLSKKVGADFLKAQEALAEEKTDESLKILEELLSNQELSIFERATIYRLQGYVYAEKEDYQKSIESLQQSLSFNALELQAQLDLQFGIAQLYLAIDQWGNGLREILDWSRNSNSSGVHPGPSFHALLSQIYLYIASKTETGSLAEKQFYEKAAPHAENAILIASKPRENWYQIYLSTLLFGKRYEDARPILEGMVKRFPERDTYKRQLSGLYYKLDVNDGLVPPDKSSQEIIYNLDFGEPQFEAFSASTDADVLPIVKVPPPYPRRAMERCLEGWGLVEFTVTETGAVINPRIIDADPPGIFNRSILRTIVKWKYKPTISKGKAVQVTGIQHLLTYELDDGYQIKCIEKNHKSSDNVDVYPIKRVQAKYPKKEKELGIEGSVIVEFDVLTSGKVNNPIITSSKPTGVFNKSSLEAARKWRYLPAKINGKPINRKRVRLMITYRNGLTSALPIGYGKYD